jgi:hypothetical protein
MDFRHISINKDRLRPMILETLHLTGTLQILQTPSAAFLKQCDERHYYKKFLDDQEDRATITRI